MKAILLCAGTGSRLKPLTELKPKPLIEIGGKTVVVRIIKMLHEVGVEDITVVGGYKHELLLEVIRPYNVDFVLSENYATTNNCTSLQLVADRLNDCFIVDGDLYLQENIFKYCNLNVSQFLSQKILSGSEWRLHYDQNNVITAMEKDATSVYLCIRYIFLDWRRSKIII